MTEERRSVGGRASPEGSPEPRGGPGRPRGPPPSPPVPMNRSPTSRQTASVPPTVVAPTAPWTAHAARSRGPTLRAEASNRSNPPGERPPRILPSSTPILPAPAPPPPPPRPPPTPPPPPAPPRNPGAATY